MGKSWICKSWRQGSHRNYVHPDAPKPVTISGNRGDEAKHYQIRAVRLALLELKK
ncbi:MAG: type II toxin-antitoxin system HicA family toxin [Pseudomonadota bacterium]